MELRAGGWTLVRYACEQLKRAPGEVIADTLRLRARGESVAKFGVILTRGSG